MSSRIQFILVLGARGNLVSVAYVALVEVAVVLDDCPLADHTILNCTAVVEVENRIKSVVIESKFIDY